MKANLIIIATLVAWMAACASGFNRGEMDSSLRAANPFYTSSDLFADPARDNSVVTLDDLHEAITGRPKADR